MISIEEYLAEEGIVDLSDKSHQELLDENLDPIFHDEFESIAQRYMHNNIQENIKAYYSYSLKHPELRDALDGMLYQRTVATAPIVNSYLWRSESLLEIGCGTGLRSVFYAINNPGVPYLATDINEDSLAVAEKRAQKYGCSNISFDVADSTNLLLDKTFDVVFSEYSLHETMEWGDSSFSQKLKEISNIFERRSIIVLTPTFVERLKSDMRFYAQEAGMIFNEMLEVPSIKFNQEFIDLVMVASKNK